MRNTTFKLLIRCFLIVLTIMSVIGVFFYLDFSSFIGSPVTPSAQTTLFTVKPGQGLSSIAQDLKNQKIIDDPFYFKLYARFKKADKKVMAGEYLLSASQSPEQILITLVSGKVKLYKVTIPEGFNIKEIASVLEAKKMCTAQEFTELCSDKNFIEGLGVKALSLEGYLFPDTYFFPKQTTCSTIIETMVKNFRMIYQEKWHNKAASLGFSQHEIVTLASIIEKETGDPNERPLISSVFHNRLKKRMRLESDPTVIYGIKDFDGNIKRKHLKMLTPYNTYKIKGLPVGPIASPGEKSLEAALYPAKSDYLFFVSKKDTTHYFSKTLKEHNRAVRKYQLKRK